MPCARRDPQYMLGHTHALSGLAVGAATLPWAPVHGAVAQGAWIAAVGGFAMLPDLDHRGSTVSDMWGPVTDVPSGGIGAITGGHRWGTHDAVLAPLAFGALALLAANAFWSSLLVLALAIGLALHALHFVIPGRAETTILGNLVLSWGGAWLLLTHMPNPAWLPWAVTAGVLTHILGDALTKAGVPVPVLWLFTGQRLSPLRLRTGATLEKSVVVPALGIATCYFAYANTGLHGAVDPIVQRVLAGG